MKGKKRGRPFIPVEDRFWDKVKKTDGCWEWQAQRRRSGYGHIKVLGKSRRAHRVSWEMTKGLIPEGLVVCHRCDNPACVRPDHLFLETNKDNSADCIRKGRKFVMYGEDHTNSILTWEKVRQIREEYIPGHPTRSANKLALKFGVTRSAIGKIVRREMWRDG